MSAFLTLIENGEVFAPTPRGRRSLLLADGRIAKIGDVDRRAVEALGVEHEAFDATGLLVVPGLIDPHEHLLGGSGEQGFSTQTPEFFLSEIVGGGITTVVGVLGADTTMKTMAGLLAKAKALREQGLGAFIWTGGYDVPPTTIMQTVRDDILFIDEVIGAGEIAISDRRAQDPLLHELARVATNAYVGGTLARKAGLTHLHVGDCGRRLAPVRELIEEHDVDPAWLYLTHIERSEALMREAIQLAARGVAVDIDTVEEDLHRWLRFYLEEGGNAEQLTISTDAALNSPRTLHAQLQQCVRQHGVPLEQLLPLVTRNPARILSFEDRGVLEVGRRGDVLLLERGSLDVVHVLCNGVCMVRDGEVVVQENFLPESNRRIELRGQKPSATEA